MSPPLLGPDTSRIGRPPGPPAIDRAPDHVAAGTPEPLRSELIELLGADRVLSRAIDLIRYASDASPYRYIPQVVVMAHDEADVSKVLAYACATGTHLTFRGGGTSLNGQAQSDAILIDVRRHFSGVEVLDGGARARVAPGTLLGYANRVLRPRGFRLGPDPASTDIATVGGVVVNNSGGMRCGTTWDSYSTVESMRLVLASGAVINTADPGAEERFAELEGELARELLAIRAELLADGELAARVRRKYEIKNVTGYRLCAFLDAETPLEIFRRLVIGSEGTLAFVAEATFRTRPEPKATTVAWIHFASIEDAVAPVNDLVAAGARATELMIAPALMTAAWNIPGTPEHWKELPMEAAALLVEFGGDSDSDLDERVAEAERILVSHKVTHPPDFTRDREAIELAWTVREGLFGLIGRIRPLGTALIIEDVCVDPSRIAECCREVIALLGEHGFLPGVAGHVSAGNIHFQLTPDFSKPEDVERYETFIGKLVDLIVDTYDGSLKAEHGTGLNMAPFVEREWGEKATEWMWRVKRAADPNAVLNPGAVLNRDPKVHLRNLKTQPEIEESAAHCVECGFCEPVCPSRNTTTTPRQRIVLRRELARQPEGSPVYEAILADFEHDAIQTCAADGTCISVCPVAIDTGKLMKDFRRRERTPREEKVAAGLAKHYATVERSARLGLRSADVMPGRLAAAMPALVRSRVSADIVPSLPPNMPPAAPATLPRTRREGAAAVYMPACINRIFGNPRDTDVSPTLPEALVTVSERAGLPVWIPEDVAGNCCTTPWNSKGYESGAALMAQRVAESLLRWSEEGALVVVIDATSCAHGLLTEVVPHLDEATAGRFARLEILDSISWAHDHLLPKLEISRKLGSVVLHPTCSTAHLGLGTKLENIAEALAEEVFTPPGTTCCGMAGDRGMLHPELPASALRDVVRELEGTAHDAHLCSNRTCEIGLQQQTGRPYASFIFALEALSR